MGQKFLENLTNIVGKRFKFGGEPEFITIDEWPMCQCCKERSLFMRI